MCGDVLPRSCRAIGSPHPGTAVRAAPTALRIGHAMRIAQIAPLYEAVPPAALRRHGAGIAALCDGLVDRGHDVDPVRRRTARRTAADLECHGPPLRERMSRARADRGGPAPPPAHARRRLRTRRTTSTSSTPTSTSGRCPSPSATATPSVLTLHGRLDTDLRPGDPAAVPRRAARIGQRQPTRPLRGTERAMGGHRATTAWTSAATRTNETARRRPPRLRRAHQSGEGPDLAIEVARRSGRPLHIAAKVDPIDVDYFETTSSRCSATTSRSSASSTSAEAQLLRQRSRHPVPQRLARALRTRDDRVPRRRHARHRAPSRRRPRGARRRRHRLHLRRRRRDGRGRPTARRDRPGGLPAPGRPLHRDTMCAGYEEFYGSLVRVAQGLALESSPIAEGRWAVSRWKVAERCAG